MADPGDILSLLQCSVCLETFTNPRTLPCAHTFCLSCVEPLVQVGSLRCPQCRSRHSVPYTGPKDYFPPNLVAIGLLDKLCTSCSKAFPDADCQHCGHKLCNSCIARHGNHQVASESQAELHRTIQDAEALILETNPHQHVIFSDIGALASAMHQKVDDGIQCLTSTVSDKLLTDIVAYRDWSAQMNAKITEARRIHNESSGVISQPYNSDTAHDIMQTIESCQSMHTDIESFMSHTPSVALLSLKYDIHDLPSIESCVSITAHRTELDELMALSDLRDLLTKACRLYQSSDQQDLAELGKQHLATLLGDLASSGALDLPVINIAVYWGICSTLTRLEPINTAGFVHYGGLELGLQYLAQYQDADDIVLHVLLTLYHVTLTHHELFLKTHHLHLLTQLLHNPLQRTRVCSCRVLARILYYSGIEWRVELKGQYLHILSIMMASIDGWSLEVNMDTSADSLIEEKAWLEAVYEPALQYFGAWLLRYFMYQDIRTYRPMVEADNGLNVISRVMKSPKTQPNTKTLLQQILLKGTLGPIYLR